MEQDIQVTNKITEIIVFKEREHQNDRKLSQLQKKQKAYFFTHQIKNKMKEAGATEKEQNAALQLFVKETDEKLYKREQIFKFYKLKMVYDHYRLRKFQKQLQELFQKFLQMIKQFRNKQQECLPLLQIINKQFQNLKIIHIQYQLKTIINNLKIFRYSISAFELFKVINDHKHLEYVTIKGVQVTRFQQFISRINQFSTLRLVQEYEGQEEQELQEKKEKFKDKEKQEDIPNWIKNFNPSKQLKISINASIKFDVSKQKSTLSNIKDLLFFRRLFYSLSDITAVIYLGWSLYELKDCLLDLWICLRQINKIKLEITIDCGYTNQFSGLRSLLFGGLTSLTEIIELSFISISINDQVGINNILAMEKSVSTLFKNNAVTHLRLSACQNFPVFPEITTLQSLSLSQKCIHKQVGFMRQMVLTNPSLKYIKYKHMYQQQRINEKLLNQLETLLIENCDNIVFDKISSQSPSKIKHLQILNSNFGGVDSLSLVFSKLVNLTYLQLRDFDFGHQLLCKIPSPHLEELHIWKNNAITEKDVQVIDAKWPQLTKITLYYCSKVTVDLWSVCKFKGLVEILVDYNTLGKGGKVFQQLKSRGIRVDYA